MLDVVDDPPQHAVGGDGTGRGGEAAILIDGDHVLATPARTVAAGRVLWWVVDDVEHRLETDRSRADLLDMGRTLAD